MTSGSITSGQIDGETTETVTVLIFLGSKITADRDCSHKVKRHLAPWKKRYDKPRQHIKKQRYHFANKGLYSQSYGFSSSFSPLLFTSLFHNYLSGLLRQPFCFFAFFFLGDCLDPCLLYSV